MDSIVGEDPTLPLDFDYSVNMSHLPDMSGLDTPRRTNGHAHNHDASRRSDPGPIPVHQQGMNVNERMSPSSNRNMKDYGTQISDLKKENFSLKLRIFYMEERMQQHFNGDHDELWRTNIELKVECDSLRKELSDKHDLLVKASNAVACMETSGPDQMRKAKTEAEKEVAQLREVMNEKVATAERELQAAHQDSELALEQAMNLKKELEDVKAANEELSAALTSAKEELEVATQQLPDSSHSEQLFDQHQQLYSLQKQVEELKKDLLEKDRTIAQLKNSLSSQQTVIELLNEEKRTVIGDQIQPLMQEVEQFKHKLKDAEVALKNSKQAESTSEATYQEHITEQQQRLDEYELATKQMAEELEKRETEVKDLREALKDAEDNAEELRSSVESYANAIKEAQAKTTKDVHKRDRAIAGLTQIARKKDEEIAELKQCLQEKDASTDQLLTNLRELEKAKSSSSRESIVQQLRLQLKESDTALQNALDDRCRNEDDHERRIREYTQQCREKDREIGHLKSQLSDYEEKVASLDGVIREKDQELQSLVTKHKNLLRDLELKEDERLRAIRERDDLIAQCEEEKQRFSNLADRMLRRSGVNEFDTSTSQTELESVSRIRELENELLIKSQIVKEATSSRDLANTDREVARNELEKALKAREEEADVHKRTIGLRDVEIRQLKDLIRSKDEASHDLEEQLRYDLKKLSSLNANLQDKLATCEQELEDLKSKQSTHRNLKQTNLNKRSNHGVLSDSVSEDREDTGSSDVENMRRQLAEKDRIIMRLKQSVSFDKAHYQPDYEDAASNRDHIHSYVTHNHYNTRPKSRKSHNHSSHNDTFYDQANFTTTSDDSGKEPPESGFNRLRQVYIDNPPGNMTFDTTLGLPLDQTSYLGMPDGYHSDSDDFSDLKNLSPAELKQLLVDTRNRLNKAVQEVSDIKNTLTNKKDTIHKLEELVRSKTEENKRLLKQYNEAVGEKMSKEAEVLKLLSKIQDADPVLLPTQMHSFKDAFTDETSEDESIASRSRRLSGDESDGMSSLSRRELGVFIRNLKKKLTNAEKVNELLKKQIHNSRMEEQDGRRSSSDTQLISSLSAEVEQLKRKLKENNANELNDQSSILRTPGISLLRSKLPVPVQYKGGNIGSDQSAQSLRGELDRARMLNRKLNERLAATEQTVRQQADKLHKCRAALAEAGIASPSASPIRAARSVPNLLVTLPNDCENEKSVERIRSFSSDTNDASTQTRTNDSGITSVSPKSEQKFNSLIQAQAKELSSLRQQLKQSRDFCKQLQSKMDAVNRYMEALLTSGGEALDPALVRGVNEELERSRNLVAKMKKCLSDNVDDNTQSDEGDDSSLHSSSQLNGAAKNAESLYRELAAKNNLINNLNNRIEVLEARIRSPKTHRVISEPHSPDKWRNSLNAPPLGATPVSSQDHFSGDIFPQRPSSMTTDLNIRSRHGMLTPTSSHQSLHSASEDEMMLSHHESSRQPTRMGGAEGDYISTTTPALSNSNNRASWPMDHRHPSPSNSLRKSIPFYQRTIAVTEYLPPNVQDHKENRILSPSCGIQRKIEIGRHRRLSTSADACLCTASYGGKWASPYGTPTKLDERFNSSNRASPLSPNLNHGESSCDDDSGQKNHKLAREVDRLRRRLADSKRMNKSLKEELDLSNQSLQKTKDLILPGYQRSVYSNAGSLAEHLNEIRGLRQRLEQSIATNDKLREKLDNRLREAESSSTDRVSANIYLSPENGRTVSAKELANLQNALAKYQEENSKLKSRLKTEEKAHASYQNAIQEMKAMQQHVIDKSDKIEQLTKHLKQLKGELDQQTSVSKRLGDQLALRDADLAEMKMKLELAEEDARKMSKGEETAKASSARLRHDVNSLKSQLDECHQLIGSLKSELNLHEKVQSTQSKGSLFTPPPELDLSELLQEIRSLRIQLERSIEANAALRKQLEEQLKSPRQRDESPLTTINIHHLSPSDSRNDQIPRPTSLGARRKLHLDPYTEEGSMLMTPPASASSGGEEHSFYFDPNRTSNSFNHSNDVIVVSSPVRPFNDDEEDGNGRPFYSVGGPYTMCKSKDFAKLQKIITKSGLLARSTDSKIAEQMKKFFRPSSPEKRILKEIWKSVSCLCHHIDNSDHLLALFWPVMIPYPSQGHSSRGRTRSFSSSGAAAGGQYSPADYPNRSRKPESSSVGDVNSEADGLRREVGKLRRRLSSQDRLLQTTVERLHTTNRLKEGIEHAIVKQLSRTHDVLRKARGNLEAKVNIGNGSHYVT